MTPDKEFQLGFNLILVSIFFIFGSCIILTAPIFYNSNIFVLVFPIGLIIFGIGAFYSVKTKEMRVKK